MTFVIIRYTKNFSNIMSIKIESSRITDKRVSYRHQSPTSNGNERLCFQLHIDQMSIKIESSRNIYKRVSYIHPEVRLEIATSVFASDFELIKR